VPDTVVEFAGDTAVDEGRYRHPVRYLRVRDDISPEQLTHCQDTACSAAPSGRAAGPLAHANWVRAPRLWPAASFLLGAACSRGQSDGHATPISAGPP
jgi:hypothetical protein